MVEARVRAEVCICEEQNGLMPIKNTTEAVFALRMLIEKYREGELHVGVVHGWRGSEVRSSEGQHMLGGTPRGDSRVS